MKRWQFSAPAQVSSESLFVCTCHPTGPHSDLAIEGLDKGSSTRPMLWCIIFLLLLAVMVTYGHQMSPLKSG